MGKNGINARRRRGAVAIATVMAISGLAGCSKAPNRPDSQVVSGFIEESTDEALYGGRLDVVLNQPGYVPANFTFSKETFGVRDDVYSDYTTEQHLDESKGPIELKISFSKGKLRVKDLSPNGIDPAAKQWLMTRIKEREEFFLAAGRRGGFRAINFRLNVTDIFETEPADLVKDMTGDATFENDVNIVFPRSALNISAAVFDQMIVHEVTHLLAAKLSEEFLEDGRYSTKVSRVQNACKAIREKAQEQIQTYTQSIANELVKASDLTANPKYKVVLKTLAKKYEDGSFPDLYPENDPKFVEIQEPQFGAGSAPCATNSLLRQMGLVEDILGIETDDGEFEDFMNSDALIHVGSAEKIVTAALADKSLFRFLAEKTYDPQNNFGHGFDNINEQLASAIALVTSPMNTGFFLTYGPKKETDLINEFFDATTDLLIAGFPELEPFLGACSKDLKRFIQLNYEPVSEACNFAIAH